MTTNGQLSLRAAFASLQGRREDNQDYVGIAQPSPQDLACRGVVTAVADGMGGAKGGRVAAELCVHSFMEAYYSLAETLGMEQLLDRCLDAANRWIHAMGRRDPNLAHMATTFSALILRGRRAHLVHVGDSRVYRLRGERLELLTADHTLNGPELDHILYRAVGLEPLLRTDYAVHTLEAHDRFLLCSDGLYGALRQAEIARILLERATPQSSADTLVELAFEHGSNDNITALVMDVIALPKADRQSLRETIEALPILELPTPGETVDDFQLERSLSSGRYSALFLAIDRRNGNPVVVKFPHPRVASEREYHDAFLREAWIGARVKSPWVAEILEQPPGRQSRLYSVMPYYPGTTLEQYLGRKARIGLEPGIDLALKLCKAVHALHRQQIVHRDIKPDNILLPDGGGLKLLDLGIARLPAWDEDQADPMPGTASYMAPELFHGERGSVASDVFALGVTLYRLFSGGAYPYGEIEPFSTPRFGKPRPLTGRRPDLPVWLDAALARAVAVDPDERYADAIELAFELESGLSKGGGKRISSRPIPLYQRNPVLFWQLTALLLFGLLMACLFQAHGRV
ncbi:bifunctional protein-serine/threonine kinase/phosphatase [Methylocaldum sp.]|uniref:bifunctional protein-serine/threonine kinase/phosphatase n=1 Tax=Methylocaldum sp. TaxID=1969727 RepID=UPI002D66AB16|nr:protein kinase [Methylocaldum sp.]HYE36501.1 protein kinase [Methylocaldum sp.]